MVLLLSFSTFELRETFVEMTARQQNSASEATFVARRIFACLRGLAALCPEDCRLLAFSARTAATIMTPLMT